MVNKTGLLAVVLAVTLAGSAVTAAVVVQEQETAGEDLQSQTLVSVVHMSPDAPAVDVTVGNQTVAENVSFGDATQYTYLSAGTYNVTVTAAEGAPADNATETPGMNETETPGTNETEAPGLNETETPGAETPGDETEAPGMDETETPAEGTPDDGAIGGETPDDGTPGEDTPTEEMPGEDDATDDAQGEVLYETTVTLDARDVTSIVAQGEATEGGAAPFELVPMSDDAWTPTQDNSALRVAHFSPDAPAVDVTAENGSVVLADNVTVGNTSEYASVPAGEYTVEIREESADNNGTVVTTVNVTLESEEAYTAWAGGYAAPEEAAGNESLQVFLTQDASSTVELPTQDAQTPAPETPTPAPEETETPGMNETETPGMDGTETPGMNETEAPGMNETETPGLNETETPTEGEI